MAVLCTSMNVGKYYSRYFFPKDYIVLVKLSEHTICVNNVLFFVGCNSMLLIPAIVQQSNEGGDYGDVEVVAEVSRYRGISGWKIISCRFPPKAIRFNLQSPSSSSYVGLVCDGAASIGVIYCLYFIRSPCVHAFVRSFVVFCCMYIYYMVAVCEALASSSTRERRRQILGGKITSGSEVCDASSQPASESAQRC